MKTNPKFFELYHAVCPYMGREFGEWLKNHYSKTLYPNLYKAILAQSPDRLKEVDAALIWKEYNNPDKEFDSTVWTKHISELKIKLENYLLFLELENPKEFVELMNKCYKQKNQQEIAQSKFHRYIRLNELYNSLGMPHLFADMLSDFNKVCQTSYEKYMYAKIEMEIILQKEKEVKLNKQKAQELINAAFIYFFEQVLFYILYMLPLSGLIKSPFNVEKFMDILLAYKGEDNKNPFNPFINIYNFIYREKHSQEDVKTIIAEVEMVLKPHSIFYETDMWAIIFNRVEHSSRANNTVIDIHNLYFLLVYAIDKNLFIKNKKYMLQHYANVVKIAWKYQAIRENGSLSEKVITVINDYHATYHLFFNINYNLSPKEKLLLFMCYEMEGWDIHNYRKITIFTPNIEKRGKIKVISEMENEDKSIFEFHKKSFEKNKELNVRPFFCFMENRYICDDRGDFSNKDIELLSKNIEVVKEILDNAKASSQKEKLQFEYKIWKLLLAIYQMENEGIKKDLENDYQEIIDKLNPATSTFYYNKFWYYNYLVKTWKEQKVKK